jgi:Na+-translocating ferredoxin:NAD+ oxidoreductase RnfG subunit
VAPAITDPAAAKDTRPAVWSSGLILAVIAAVCTALVALTYSVTEGRIKANDEAWLEQSLQPALSGVVYDNNLAASVMTVVPPHEMPGDEPVTVYRAFHGEAPAAAC